MTTGRAAASFVALLKACAQNKDLQKGISTHAEIVDAGLLDKNFHVASTLISMYAKCGALRNAQQVFDGLSARDVVNWNALMAGYAFHGHHFKVLQCSEQMQYEGLSANAVTLICTLKACCSAGAADKIKQIHGKILSERWLQKDIVLGTTLMDMYAKIGAFTKAQGVLDELPVRDTVTWNSLITGYVQNGRSEEALKCFDQMQHEGLSSNISTFVSVLKACSSTDAGVRGKQVHDEIVCQGLMNTDLSLGTALVDMYVKCCDLGKARQVLDELPSRDIVCWNALLSGYAQQGQSKEALNCYERMQREGHSPNTVTFICLLQACASMGAVDSGKQIHREIVKQGLLGKDIVLGNALVDMYAKCNSQTKAQEVLDELIVRDVVSWNALIVQYAQQDQGKEALDCFKCMQYEGLSPDSATFLSILKACANTRAQNMGKQMHDELVRQGLLENDIALGSALIDMYAKCGEMPKAQELVNELPFCDAATWTALISGYAQQGQGKEALRCFEQMQREGLSPTTATFACVLKACGIIGAIGMGNHIYEQIVSQGLLVKDNLLGNALVDMYAKCGMPERAQQVLAELPFQDVVSWSAVIAGYAEQEQGEEALNCFDQMQREGFSPNAVTFTSILKACGIVGASSKGKQIHDEIVSRGLLEESVVLGNALVDMYARCGALVEAQKVHDELLFRDIVSWNALIAGFAQHGHGKEALACFEQMECDGISPDPATFTSMLNACAHSGLVNEGQKFFTMMNKYGLMPEIEQQTCVVDLLGRAGHFNKALVMFKRLPCLNDSLVWSAILGACLKWGNVKLGRWAFEHAMEVDKSFPEAYACMASIYADAGMQEDAYKIEAMRMKCCMDDL